MPGRIDPTHQHFASDIIQDDNPHTPINPSGSVEVTDGTTTVSSAASIVMPAGTVSDLGNGVAGIGLMFSAQTVTLTPATPNLINPNDNGPEIIRVPAGSFVRAVPITTVAWDTDSNLSLGAGSTSANAVQVCYTDLLSFQGLQGVVAQESAYEHDTLNNYVSGFPKWFYAQVECGVYAAVYPVADSPVAGELVLLIEIASPVA